MRSVPDVPVFGRAELADLGWSDSAITRAVRSGKLVRLRKGQFASPSPDRPRLEVAAVRACAGSVVSHRSALGLFGLPVVGRPVERPELTVAPRRIGRLEHAHLHRATLLDIDSTTVDGVPVTTVGRTLVDVARTCPITTAVAAMDAALYRRLMSTEELEQVLVRCWNWPGIRRAQRAVALVDGRAESPLESISRLVMRWLRLPAPDLQPVVLDEDGIAVARLDFYWDEFGVAGEADGRMKYAADGRTALLNEKDRQERVEDLGVAVTRWGWELPWRRPHELRARIERAFERGRRRDRSGLPRLWTMRPTIATS